MENLLKTENYAEYIETLRNYTKMCIDLIDEEFMTKLNEINCESNLSYEDIDLTMDILNKMIRGYGVEAITVENQWVDQYYMNIVGLYINLGDTYDTTIIYDTAEDKFVKASWGDYFEEILLSEIEE